MDKRLLIFASGSASGGGSGFKELVENSRSGILDAKIVGVVSNHEHGGVRKIADEARVRFHLLENYRQDELGYQSAIDRFNPDLIALSGWMRQTIGLDPRITINIHPGPLPEFGGAGMYGHHVHEAVIEAYKRGETTRSAVSMHFVTEEYDRGPVFFRYPVWIRSDDDADSLGSRVNKIEHSWQSFVTNEVLHGRIHWDGVDPDTLFVPNYIPYKPT
jgi:folate-dependent phosphoribosylglycinamide formyltransferase PurN